MPTISQGSFGMLVAEVASALPEWVRRAADNVDIVVDDEPPEGEEEILGLYHGVPLPSRDGSQDREPDTITLFAGPIERMAGGDPAQLRRIVRETLVHELCHHFGLEDDDLLRIRAY